MKSRISELTPEHASRIRDFNARLRGGGVEFTFTVQQEELLHPKKDVDFPHQVAYVLEDDTAVRGGYILKREQVFLNGDWSLAANYQLPLSEGIIDRRHAIVGVELIRDALGREARLYSLGMGGVARPLPRLLQRLGWNVVEVPFFFRVQRGYRFAREIRWLRQQRKWRFALDAARFTGVASLYATAAAVWRRRRRFGAAVTMTVVEELPAEIDELFGRVAPGYGLLFDRRSAAMNQKMPPGDAKFLRLLLHRDGRLIGWVLLTRSQLEGHRQFGNMKLGAIVDGLAASADVELVVAAACEELSKSGCDLLVSNQTHPWWIDALQRQGFLRGPSNFVLATSPALSALQGPNNSHFNRGDGDGPINL